MTKLKTKNSKLKTKSRWLLKALILAAILWLIFMLITRALQHSALAQITELTKARIETYSVDFGLNGSVLIEKLVIRPPLVAGASRPGGERKYDDAILEAETVYARFSVSSLLLLRPRLKEIRVNDFVFNAIQDLDTGRWNLTALDIESSKAGGVKMPVIRLEKGTLRYSKVSNSRLKVAAEVPLDARFGPAKKTQDAYSFDITTAETATGFGKSTLTGLWRPGNITIAGAISSADIPALERAWTMNALGAELNYDRGNNYSLKLRIKDLLGKHTPAGNTFAPDAAALLGKFGLFTALQRFFNRYRPAGRVDIDLEAAGSLDRLSESTLVGRVYCKDVSICDRKFPYAVGHMAGPVDFTEKGASLNNISGTHRSVKLFFNGFTKDFGPNWKYKIRIASDNMALDDDLFDALGEEQKKLWSAFSPTGLAAIDYQRTHNSQADKKATLAVELRGAEAAYSRFPYPLKNLAGGLFFTGERITISDLLSQVDGRKININGKVTGRNTDRPVYDISIKANNIPLDSTLAASLPAGQRNFYNRFDMTGLADADIKIFTPDRDVSATSFTADVSFKKTSLRINQSPPRISDISAKVVFTPDLIRIHNLTGRCGQGRVSLTGLIWPALAPYGAGPADKAEQLRYYLALHAERTELNSDLLGLLPKSLGEVVAKLQPEGKVNLTADLNEAGGAGYPDYSITVDCLGNSVNFEPFPYPLKDITGTLTITTDAITLAGLTATIADDARITPWASTIRLDGQIALAGDTGENGWFRPLAGDVTLTAETLRIKGKALTNLKADIYYDRRTKNWLTENLVADSYGGRVIAKVELKRPDDRGREYLLQTGFENIDLKRFLSDTPASSVEDRSGGNGYTSGKMSGSLSVSATVGDSLPHIGRCRLRITNMQVGKLSPLAKLLQVLKLTEPEDFAFEQMFVDSFIENERVFLERLDLSGEAIAFNGSGEMNLRSRNVDLTLTARGRRLATAEPSVLQSLTEGLGRGVVRIDVTGNVYDPDVKTTTLPVIKGTLQILGTKKATR